MGQEISQQRKCNIIRRHKSHHQIPPTKSIQPKTTQRDITKNPKTTNNNLISSNGKYTRHSQDFQNVYAPTSSISTASSSSTDEEPYRLRQKYNLNKQTYEKFRVSKKLSLVSNSTDQSTSTSTSTSNSISTSATSSNYQNSKSSEPTYNNIERRATQHRRKNSSSTTDSGVYYAPSHCTSSFISSSATSSSSLCSTSACCCATSVTSSSNQSRSSLDQKKNYLCKHLYIKSYLDILEEDEKARAQFKSARPGGIRNYKPKILGEATLSSSAPHSTGFSISSSNLKLREKCKEDPWI
ncbi:A-agglutinin anchorage subunit [Ceratitis capitata]|uniref:A-agglutinin anchorage subunit n=1 Tax=Ceratitis capitata TaxID=7213 RepID=UPI000A1146AC|nr:A-agglutinin anchorage subunit [Ceratitis capitata]